ncbi:hypothetical protein HHI36_000468 [Cryptolaemus montrouzieri]|uniref:Uncharacterized protein n=1 Tax=Cryptolaemus montrouzieri TaxID=559131 RepID=A0ABD2P5G3_9CUCU
MNAWDQVLLQWCNCLELSKEIGDLNELRNGDFFTNLYGIISSSEIQNEDTMLTRLLCFLKGKYVNFQTEGCIIVHFLN